MALLNNEIELSPLQFEIYCLLFNNPDGLVRREIVKKLDTPRTTIFDNLVKLHQKKIVERVSKNNGKRGRPKIFWKIKENYYRNHIAF